MSYCPPLSCTPTLLPWCLSSRMACFWCQLPHPISATAPFLSHLSSLWRSKAVSLVSSLYGLNCPLVSQPLLNGSEETPDRVNSYKRKHLTRDLVTVSKGLVHFHHGGEHGSPRADMALEKQLRVLHSESQGAGRERCWPWHGFRNLKTHPSGTFLLPRSQLSQQGHIS